MDIKKKLVLIYLLTLLPRIYQLEATQVYPDEITWMTYGKEFVYALKNFNLDYFKNSWWNISQDDAKYATYAIGLPVVFLNGLSHVVLAGTGQYSLRLLSDIAASRLPVVLLHSLLPAFIYYYVRKLLNDRVALVAALSYALSPVAIGLDRWVIHDSSLTLFSFLSVVSYVVYAKQKQISFLPGIFLAAAFLVKPTGLIGATVWIIALIVKRDLKLFVVNSISFWVAVTLFWPQSWFLPIISVIEYLFRQLNSAQVPHNYFFMGRPVEVLPAYFYAFQLIFRTPEVVLISIALAVLAWIKLRIFKNPWFWAITVYWVCFFVVLSVVPLKHGFRYILPLLPWMYIASAWGILQLKSRILLAVYFTFLLMPLAYHPNTYSLYYNHLIGGGSGAQRYDQVGLCTGDKAALDYLDKSRMPGTVAVAGCNYTAAYHTMRTVTQDWKSADLLILQYAHWQQFPDNPEVRHARHERELIHTVVENGVTTAWVYR